MASPKRAAARPNKRRPLPLPAAMRRAMLHSFLCFLVGLLTGFTPSHWTTAVIFSTMNNHAASMISMSALLNPGQSPPPPLRQPQLLVVVTATELSDPERRAAGLTRTAHALRLVPPPLLWLVVEEPAAARDPQNQAAARVLRGAGVMYRHLTYSDNFTDAGSERHHQRNVALGHVEEHRLAGVVLFAGLADVYDLRFFHHLREIRTLGAWPVATVWDQYERKVMVEGPLCAAGGSAITGWFSSTSTSAARSPTVRRAGAPPAAYMDVRGFAFSSSILWDPSRWDRFPVSEPDASQDSVRFVQRLVAEEYNKSRGMPDTDCSEIMVWRGDHLLTA